MAAARVLSFSEVSMALDCQAKWDFAYGGHLAGTALRAKSVAPLLSAGRAWGAAVATFHANLKHPDPGVSALRALDASLDEDAERQREFGVHDQERHDEIRVHLLKMLLHYMDTAAETGEDLPCDRSLERELLVPLPSRTGQRKSNRYKLLSYLDGTRTVNGRTWLREYKLRTNLTPVWLIQNYRQIRWYSWGYWQETGDKPAGVEVVERWNQAPKKPRIVKAKRKGEGIDGMVPSHAKDQLCTAADYAAVCEEYGVEPSQETLEELGSRKWQQTVPILFRESELDEVGEELVSAGVQIHALDTGEILPLRNAKAQNCNGCQFREICPSPDNELVDALFERVPAKRDRQKEAAAA